MTLQTEDINEIYQGKDTRPRSNACFRSGMIEHFVRDYTTSTVNTTDGAIAAAVVGTL